MIQGAILSDCNTYRYSLHRIWNESKPLLFYIMLNPSVADANVNDRTIMRCIGFAGAYGYGGFYVGNLFAYRATDPDNMLEAKNLGKDVIGPENNQHLYDMRNKAADVVFAWGAHPMVRSRTEEIVKMFGNDAWCLGKTNGGYPKHPLFLLKTTELEKF